MQERLAIRIDADNRNHHLWNNHGTWWIHYTLDLDGLRARRVRRSLKTKEVAVARALRDHFLLGPDLRAGGRGASTSGLSNQPEGEA